MLHTSRAMQQGRNSTINGNGGGGHVATRKGPWVAEEDEILLEYVRKHGPRDWSSIRSKGLLPRTGKSCRLRWVNKLKPDLKTGCKFSVEEERIVIDLQGRFGNKWARIATYLPGRTDNDVKNFWSTRQKRLARLLQTPLQPSKSNRSHQKLHVPTFEVGSLDLIPFGEESSSGQCSQTSSFMDNTDFSSTKMVRLPYLEEENQDLFNIVDPTLPLLEPSADGEQHPMRFDHLPNPDLDFPLLLDGPVDDHLPGFAEELACQDVSRCMPFFDLGFGKHAFKKDDEHSQTLDTFFDDFPADMFDCLDQQLPQPDAQQQQQQQPASSAAW